MAHHTRRRGFTLAEILVVVAILALLFAILVPVVGLVKERSKAAREINDLHQLGLAAALYHDSSGKWPLETTELVASGSVPPEIVVSPLDASARGQANDVVARGPAPRKDRERLITTYPRSYIGPGDYRWPYESFWDAVQDQPDAGWLVSLTKAEPNSVATTMTDGPRGTYQRLTFDGSVIARTAKSFTDSKGESFYVLTLYADGDAKWIEALAKP